LNNRLVMAPLTRNRATKGTDSPNDLNARYYRQRATAGLIISEATQISQQGQGYIWTPGIYSEAQVAGWTKVTDGPSASLISWGSQTSSSAPIAIIACATRSSRHSARYDRSQHRAAARLT
jgi:hypothetical protein